MPNPQAEIDLVVGGAGKFKSTMGGVRRILDKVKTKMLAVSRAARYMLLGQTAALTGAIALYSAQEKAVARVEAAIRSQGKSVDAWSGKLQDAASAIQAVTTHGDEAVLAVMQLGLSMGVGVEQIDAATRAALGLADMLGVSTTEAMRKVARAMQGDVQALKELIPELRGIEDEAELVRRSQEILAGAFDHSKAMAKTTAGSLAQLKNTLGDLGELIGAAVMPMISAMVEAVKSVLPPVLTWIQENPKLLAGLLAVTVGATATLAAIGPLTAGVALLGTVLGALASPIGIAIAGLGALGLAFGYAVVEGDTFGEKLVSLKDTLGRAWKKAVDVILWGISFSIAAFKNWRDTLRAYVLQVALNFTTMFQELKHWLTVVIPQYLAWFGRNWKGVFKDAFAFVGHALANAWANFANFFANVWKWLKGEKTDWRWTALTKGFESSLREDLPKIAKRELSKTEKWLSAEIGKSMGKVWEDARAQYDSMRRWLDAGEEAPEAPTPGAPSGAGGPALPSPKAKAPKVRMPGGAGAAFESIAAAFNRIAGAAGRTPELKAAESTAAGVNRLVALVERDVRYGGQVVDVLVEMRDAAEAKPGHATFAR